MNTAATVKKTSLSPSRFLARLLPEKISGRILLWAAMPCFLLLLNIGISFLKPCPMTSLLTFAVFFSSCAIYRFKTLGLLVSYSALCLLYLFFYPTIALEVRLWQLGIGVNCALSLWILLLSMKEIAASLFDMDHYADELQKRLIQAESEFLLAQKTAEEKERDFRQEIEKLKDEAEQRRIEKANEAKHLAFIHSEIELLTQQKNVFIDDAKKAREETLFYQQQEEQNQLLKQELSAGLAAQKQQFEKEKLNVQEELALQHKLLEELEMLRTQEQQKYAEEGVRWRELLSEREKQFTENLKQQEQYFRDLALKADKEAVQEKQQAQALLAFQQQECIALQEKLIQLQQSPTINQIVVQDEDLELKKAYALLEASLKQLRLQFEEKNKTLSLTRKELFQTETRLLALENDRALTLLEPDRDTILSLEQEIARLTEETERMEVEIAQLEELVRLFIGF